MALAFFGIGVLLLVFQTTIFHLFPDWLGRPDLLFLLIVFIALRIESLRGLILILLLGTMMDIFSGVHLGVYLLSCLLLYLVIKIISRNLILEDVVHQVTLVMVGFLGFASLIHLLVSLLDPETPACWSWPTLLQNVVILGIISLPFFHFCRRLQGKLEEKNPLSLTIFKRRPANRFNRI